MYSFPRLAISWLLWKSSYAAFKLLRYEPDTGILMDRTGSLNNLSITEDRRVSPLRELLRVMWKRLWVIGVTAAVLTGLAVGLSLSVTPMYESSVKLLVGQDQGITETPSDVIGLQQLTVTMAEGVSSRRIAEAVIQQHDLQMTPTEFLDRLSVEQIAATQYILVSYRDPDPQRAQLVANTIGEEFSQQISKVGPSANAITATVWDRANLPQSPVSPNLLLNVSLALFLGILLGTGLVFLLEFLDDSWRSPDEVEQMSGVPTFGVIPEIRIPTGKKDQYQDVLNSPEDSTVPNAQRVKTTDILAKRLVTALSPESAASEDMLAKRLATVLSPESAASEAYRTLRTNLLYAHVDNPPKVIVLTSPGQGEGKSTTCANLGVVLAQAGKNTLLLDCDLRRPVIHKFFGLRNLSGVVDVLVEARKVQEVWNEPVPGLKVLASGRIPPNPTELLGTKRFAEMLAGFREIFDYVLVDAPPEGPVSDSAILATRGDGVLLVLDAQNTRKANLQQAIRGLGIVEANVFGTVMNNVKIPERSYYYYGHHGSSRK
jgi:capsular exopolysaccharide synthesis family protein